jgi:hypothetical protein
LLGRDAEAAERRAEAIGPLLELGVREIAGGVEERGLGAATLYDVAVDEVNGRIVGTGGVLPRHDWEPTNPGDRGK